MPLACKSLDGVIVFRFSKRKIWKKKERITAISFSLVYLKCPTENVRFNFKNLETCLQSPLLILGALEIFPRA